MPSSESTKCKNPAQRLLNLTSTYMSLITITLTTTLTQYNPPPSDTASSDVSGVIDWTAPVPIFASSTVAEVSGLVSKGTSMVVDLSSVLLSAAVTSSFKASETVSKSSTITSKVALKSLMSTPSYSSSPKDANKAQDPSTASDMPPAENGLSEGQITAIIASVISVTAFLAVLAIAIRCFVVRRRQYSVEEIPKRDLGVSPDSTISRTGGQGNPDGSRISVADSNRSSIWGDIGRSVVPASTFSGDVMDSRLWPLPPGHSERYTFFSERSSSTVDEMSETENWRDGSRDESWTARDPKSAATGRGSGVESRCDSVWGISEATMAAGIAR
ncbi:hypothetical protein F5Y13DRAFT_176229 [Hypoxylon sp. FL1857]|nr:hypothetical protein F5Y13DRAFT_176229 [Hypoxylon sp. FL1857]